MEYLYSMGFDVEDTNCIYNGKSRKVKPNSTRKITFNYGQIMQKWHKDLDHFQCVQATLKEKLMNLEKTIKKTKKSSVVMILKRKQKQLIADIDFMDARIERPLSLLNLVKDVALNSTPSIENSTSWSSVLRENAQENDPIDANGENDSQPWTGILTAEEQNIVDSAVAEYTAQYEAENLFYFIQDEKVVEYDFDYDSDNLELSFGNIGKTRKSKKPELPVLPSKSTQQDNALNMETVADEDAIVLQNQEVSDCLNKVQKPRMLARSLQPFMTNKEYPYETEFIIEPMENDCKLACHGAIPKQSRDRHIHNTLITETERTAPKSIMKSGNKEKNSKSIRFSNDVSMQISESESDQKMVKPWATEVKKRHKKFKTEHSPVVQDIVFENIVFDEIDGVTNNRKVWRGELLNKDQQWHIVLTPSNSECDLNKKTIQTKEAEVSELLLSTEDERLEDNNKSEEKEKGSKNVTHSVIEDAQESKDPPICESFQDIAKQEADELNLNLNLIIENKQIPEICSKSDKENEKHSYSKCEAKDNDKKSVTVSHENISEKSQPARAAGTSKEYVPEDMAKTKNNKAKETEDIPNDEMTTISDTDVLENIVLQESEDEQLIGVEFPTDITEKRSCSYPKINILRELSCNRAKPKAGGKKRNDQLLPQPGTSLKQQLFEQINELKKFKMMKDMESILQARRQDLDDISRKKSKKKKRNKMNEDRFNLGLTLEAFLRPAWSYWALTMVHEKRIRCYYKEIRWLMNWIQSKNPPKVASLTGRSNGLVYFKQPMGVLYLFNLHYNRRNLYHSKSSYTEPDQDLQKEIRFRPKNVYTPALAILIEDEVEEVEMKVPLKYSIDMIGYYARRAIMFKTYPIVKRIAHSDKKNHVQIEYGRSYYKYMLGDSRKFHLYQRYIRKPWELGLDRPYHLIGTKRFNVDGYVDYPKELNNIS